MFLKRFEKFYLFYVSKAWSIRSKKRVEDKFHKTDPKISSLNRVNKFPKLTNVWIS